MNGEKFPVLRISKIEWDKDHDDYENLPKVLNLEWNSQKWNIEEVSEWLSLKYDWIFDSLKIDQVGTWVKSSCCCAGGCSCC